MEQDISLIRWEATVFGLIALAMAYAIGLALLITGLVWL